MHYLTKIITFSASHRLHNPKLSDAENIEIYGVCNNPNGHGHTYTLEITVKGERNQETGMVINLHTLKDIIKREIFDHVDHKNLNMDIPWLEGVIPTTENLSEAFWDKLKKALQPVQLHRIRLSESKKSSSEYFGKEG